MPKELFHFYQGKLLLPAHEDRRIFLIATVFPDSFFYSPFKGYPSIGRSLHKLEGRAFTETVKGLFSSGSEKARPVLLGVGAHLLTDALWHPDINRAADVLSERFLWPSPVSHTLLESFLQRWFLDEETERVIIREVRNSLGLLPNSASLFTRVAKELLEKTSTPSKGVTPWKIFLSMNLHILFLLIAHHKAFSKTLWNRIVSGTPPSDILSLMAPGRRYVLKFKKKIDHLEEVADLFSHQLYQERFRRLASLFRELQGALK